MTAEEREFDPRGQEEKQPERAHGDPPDYDPPDDYDAGVIADRKRRDEEEAAEFAYQYGEAPPLRAEPEYIAGIPFYPDPKNPTLSDLAQCGLCSEVVDVGGEMREHIAWHDAERLEQLTERLR